MNFVPNLLASVEWYLLVEDCITNSDTIFSELQSHEVVGIERLHAVDVYLENAKNCYLDAQNESVYGDNTRIQKTQKKKNSIF